MVPPSLEYGELLVCLAYLGLIFGIFESMLGELTDIGREVRVFRVACNAFLTKNPSRRMITAKHYGNCI
jgi:hypothetical protein